MYQFHEALCSATVIEEAENAGSSRPVNLKSAPRASLGESVGRSIIHSVFWAQIDPVTENFSAGAAESLQTQSPYHVVSPGQLFSCRG